jgi:hypothetical protein
VGADRPYPDAVTVEVAAASPVFFRERVAGQSPFPARPNRRKRETRFTVIALWVSAADDTAVGRAHSRRFGAGREKNEEVAT